jgi:hypothetical protein
VEINDEVMLKLMDHEFISIISRNDEKKFIDYNPTKDDNTLLPTMLSFFDSIEKGLKYNTS